MAAGTVPADILLMSGTCVVNEAILTGESIPQSKFPPSSDTNEILQPLLPAHRPHILFCGSNVVQLQQGDRTARGKMYSPPHGGGVGLVMRTGFCTQKGELLRSISCCGDSVSVNNKEALAFMGVLLVFAVAASSYVLNNSWSSGKTTHFKLLMRCIMIITTVIPPELPIELSMAVTARMKSLMQVGVFCTQPFRLPYAGRVGICIFDKTGTLTSDDLQLQCVVAAADVPVKSRWNLSSQDIDAMSATVLTGCHSLITVDGRIEGHPEEKAAAVRCGLQLRGDKSFDSIRQVNVERLKMFPFNSGLARMSVIATVSTKRERSISVLVKGAPETIKPLLSSVPAEYDACYQAAAAQGGRVLALAFKALEGSQGNCLNLSRDDAESSLVFAGFAILCSPMKLRSLDTIKQLVAAGERVVMSTGDHPLTACHVSRVLGIAPLACAILDVKEGGRGGDLDSRLRWQWPALDQKDSAFSLHAQEEGSIQKMAEKFDLCVTGSALSAMRRDEEKLGQGFMDCLVEKTRVFARVTPDQKEYVVRVLNDRGHVTMMCGDGTNDVGALKQSHCGVGLLARDENDLSTYRPLRPQPIFNFNRNSRGQNVHRRHDDTHVELGDASIASPFTSHVGSVVSCVDIIRQGRGSLVTTIEIYKIIALNCLVNAFVLSVLFLDGVKFGDFQMTASGLISVIIFMLVTQAKPMDQLASYRPPASIFTMYFWVSVLSQFSVHLYAVLAASDLVKTSAQVAQEDLDLDSTFKPNALNSVMFLVAMSIQNITFAMNYQGRPFVASFFDYKPLLFAVTTSFVLTLAVMFEISPALNSLLEFAPFPSAEFRMQLVKIILADMAATVAVESAVHLLLYKRACASKSDKL